MSVTRRGRWSVRASGGPVDDAHHVVAREALELDLALLGQDDVVAVLDRGGDRLADQDLPPLRERGDARGLGHVAAEDVVGAMDDVTVVDTDPDLDGPPPVPTALLER